MKKSIKSQRIEVLTEWISRFVNSKTLNENNLAIKYDIRIEAMAKNLNAKELKLFNILISSAYGHGYQQAKKDSKKYSTQHIAPVLKLVRS